MFVGSNSWQDQSSTSQQALLEELSRLRKLEQALMAQRAEEDPWYWLTECTRTMDEQELDKSKAFKPFPKKRYLHALNKFFLSLLFPKKQVLKSRTMMCSWSAAGAYGWLGFTRPGTGVVFQSTDLDRALNLVEYVKTLWENSLDVLKEKWRPRNGVEPKRQSRDSFELDSGSYFHAVSGQIDKTRSSHPTVYVLDEAAMHEEGLAVWEVAKRSKALHLVAISTANPGWYVEQTDPTVVKAKDWPDELLPETEDAPRLDRISMEDLGKSGVAPGLKKLHPLYRPKVKVPCQGVLLGENKQKHAVLYLHYTCDPDMTAPVVQKMYEEANPVYWMQEMEMDAHAKSGQLVYPEFDPDLHVIRHEDIPENLCRFMAIDPHPRTPHAKLWIGLGKPDHHGRSDIYVYREEWNSVVYGANITLSNSDAENVFTIEQYVEKIAALEGNYIEWRRRNTEHQTGKYVRVKRGDVLPNGARAERDGEWVIERLMDQAGKGFMVGGETLNKSVAGRYDDYGIHVTDPDKSHHRGEHAIHELLAPKPHTLYGQWPRLHISDRCPELILEFRSYRYKKASSNPERELPQEGIEARCHMLDLLRYLTNGNRCFYNARMESKEYGTRLAN